MLARKSSGMKNVDLSLLRFALPENHVNQAIIGALEGLVSAVYDKKKAYRSKVEVLMSVLECLLADCLTRVSPEITSMLFDFLLKYTLMLVFHGDWMKDKGITSHTKSLFKQFKIRAEKKKLVQVVNEIEHLLELMEHDPWSNTVMTILEGGKVTDEELLNFVRKELGVFLSVRIEVLVYAKCETEAVLILEKCLQCVNRDCFDSFSQEVTHLKDLYMLILHKIMHIERIKSEVDRIGYKECLRFVKRCRNGELPFESLSKKAVGGVVTITLSEVREDTEEQHIRDLIQQWFNVFSDSNLIEMLKNLVNEVMCHRYIYMLGEELMERKQPKEKELCVEVFVRGLTLNLNEIERYEMNNDYAIVKELKVQFANAILHLAEYMKSDFLLYREFVLTAFSFAPSQNSLDIIKAVGQNNGKVIDSQDQYFSLKTPTGQHINEHVTEGNRLEKIAVGVDKDDDSLKSVISCVLPVISSLSLKEEYIHNIGDDNHEIKSKIKSTFIEAETLQSFKVYDAKSIGISQSLCDDLATLVNSVKNRTLLWELEWAELCLRCENYLAQYDSDKNTHRVDDAGLCQEGNISNRLYLAKTPSKSSKRKRKH